MADLTKKGITPADNYFQKKLGDVIDALTGEKEFDNVSLGGGLPFLVAAGSVNFASGLMTKKTFIDQIGISVTPQAGTGGRWRALFGGLSMINHSPEGNSILFFSPMVDVPDYINQNDLYVKTSAGVCYIETAAVTSNYGFYYLILQKLPS